MLILLAAGTALLGGISLGAAMTVVFGAHAAVRFAQLLYSDNDGSDQHDADREDQDAEDDALDDDEESRLDALVARQLVKALEMVIDSDTVRHLTCHTDLQLALDAAHERFDDWIEWAEHATEAKGAVAPAGAEV